MYIRLEKGIYMVAGGSGGPGISNFKDCNVYLGEGERDAFPIDGGSGSASASAETYYAIYHPQEGNF